MNHKKQKYEGQILNQLNIIVRKMNDVRFKFVSMTKIELNGDNTVAKVYWDTFDPEKAPDVKKAMKGVAGRMRSLLSKELRVRAVPFIELVYDDQFEEERRISRIIADAKKN